MQVKIIVFAPSLSDRRGVRRTLMPIRIQVDVSAAAARCQNVWPAIAVDIGRNDLSAEARDVGYNSRHELHLTSRLADQFEPVDDRGRVEIVLAVLDAMR